MYSYVHVIPHHYGHFMHSSCLDVKKCVCIYIYVCMYPPRICYQLSTGDCLGHTSFPTSHPSQIFCYACDNTQCISNMIRKLLSPRSRFHQTTEDSTGGRTRGTGRLLACLHITRLLCCVRKQGMAKLQRDGLWCTVRRSHGLPTPPANHPQH